MYDVVSAVTCPNKNEGIRITQGLTCYQKK